MGKIRIPREGSESLAYPEAVLKSPNFRCLTHKQVYYVTAVFVWVEIRSREKKITVLVFQCTPASWRHFLSFPFVWLWDRISVRRSSWPGSYRAPPASASPVPHTTPGHRRGFLKILIPRGDFYAMQSLFIWNLNLSCHFWLWQMRGQARRWVTA